MRSSGNSGVESQCGWCKDCWGFSWQITPRALTDGYITGNSEVIPQQQSGKVPCPSLYFCHHDFWPAGYGQLLLSAAASISLRVV
jgi:hypothetical protein